MPPLLQAISFVPCFKYADVEDVVLFTSPHIHYLVDRAGQFNENYYGMKHELLEHIASAQDLSRCASGTLETDPGGAAPSAGVAAAPDAGAEPPPGTSAPPRPAAVQGDATEML